MTLNPAQILASIPQWVKESNAASLAAHAEHADKEVRKQVRKGIHQLKARGVAVPTSAPQTWSFSSSSLSDLRPEVADRAFVESLPTNGCLQIYLVQADAHYGGSIYFARLDAFDRVVSFEAYGQTDGQRARVLKQWERASQGRQVPISWARARLRWAREAMLAQGYSVPAGLDSILPTLGEVTPSRPESFVDALVAEVTPAAVSTEEDLLSRAGAMVWPVFLANEELFNRVGAKLEESKGESEIEALPPQERRAKFRAAVAAAIADHEQVRAALVGPAANLLEDAAFSAWLSNSDAWARRLLNEAQALRQAPRPESTQVGIVIAEVQIANAQRAMLAQAQRERRE